MGTRPDAEHTVNSTTPSSSSTERRMPPTTTPEDTTRSERRSLTLFWTESGSWPMLALDSRDSFSSIPSAVAPDLALPPFSWRGCLWTTERRASLSSLSTLHPRLPLPWLSPTTPSCPPTPLWSTLTAPSWLITRPSMTSAAVTWTSRDQPGALPQDPLPPGHLCANHLFREGLPRAAHRLLYRGDVVPKDVNAAIATIKTKRSIQ